MTAERIISDVNRRQLRGGKSFIHDAPAHVPAIFGSGGEVVWAEGESLLVVGPQGVGKGTLIQQLALRRAGVATGNLIGYAVEPDPERLTLYLALDRPKQIARSLKRMVADALDLGLFMVWEGPLPFDLVKRPEALAEFVLEVGELAERPVGTVCIDSLKDVASKLSSDEVGGAINRAIGGLIGLQIEVVAAHHQRKATSENKKPTSLADVYGSTWLTAGTGSVILLWGEPGDPVVEMTHLKQPAEEVGPLELHHDHKRGVTTRRDRPDAWTVLQGAWTTGVSATDVAEAVYGSASRAQREKARRRLERFVEEEKAVKIEPSKAGDPALYRPTARKGRVTPRDPARDPSRDGHGRSRTPTDTGHAPLTLLNSSPPPIRGEGERDRDDDDGDARLTAVVGADDVARAERIAAEGEGR
jgi:hypothetical protein